MQIAPTDLPFADFPLWVFVLMLATPFVLAVLVFAIAALTGRDCGPAGDQLLELVRITWSRRPWGCAGITDEFAAERLDPALSSRTRLIGSMPSIPRSEGSSVSQVTTGAPLAGSGP